MTPEECAQDAFCNMEGYAYAGWTVFVLCYIVGLSGIIYLWLHRPQGKAAIGNRLPSLSESLIENDHSPEPSLKQRSSSSGSNSSNSGNYAKVNTDNNNSSSLDDVDDKQNVNKNDEDTIEL